MEKILKRLLDIILSVTGLVISWPIILLIAVWIKLDSKGPVFYKGERIGKNGKPFKITKFRTMVADAEKLGGSSTPDDDPRITRVGKYIRKYNIDELPQLINVLKGDMSIVGPRPEVKHYIDMLDKQEKKSILSVRPGMTDYASLWNPHEGEILAGSDDPEKAYMEKIRPKKIKLQLKYVDDQSFWVDIKIILQTLATAIIGSRK